MDVQAQNSLAKSFKSLHVPGSPLILTNVYDAISTNAVASHSSTTAIATASFAVAATFDLDDDGLTLELNLQAVKNIVRITKRHNLPLTVDFQDGYGDQLEAGVNALLKMGAVGINLEDYDRRAGMLPVEVAVERIQRVLNTARAMGVTEFVVNARTDALLHDLPLSEAISRGKAYLAAGATTAFVWGGLKRGGITREEVVKLTEGLGGRLNVSMRLVGEDNLGVKDLKDIGVARISTGPGLMRVANAAWDATLNAL